MKVVDSIISVVLFVAAIVIGTASFVGVKILEWWLGATC